MLSTTDANLQTTCLTFSKENPYAQAELLPIYVSLCVLSFFNVSYFSYFVWGKYVMNKLYYIHTLL